MSWIELLSSSSLVEGGEGYYKGGIPRDDQVWRILSDMFGNTKVEQLKTLTADKRLSVAHIYFIATLNYSQQ